MPVLSYSPSHTEIALLERLTTGTARHRLIDTLVEAVRSEVGRESHQHQLLIGPRGGGKTHALTLVAHRLRTDPELASQVFPIVLAEEEVASQPADLMRRVVEKLVRSIEAEAETDLASRNTALRECRSALSAFRSEDDDERALDIAVGALEAAATALGRLLVIVIENLHSLLYAGPGLSRKTAIQGQWGLRRTLLETHGLLILGGAPSLFGEVTSPNAPFYDFFRMYHLGELSPEDMLALIQTRLSIELENEVLDPARRKRLEALEGNFEKRIPKLRGILTLTGGLPRFAHLLFDLLAETDTASVAGTISRFLDEQTPYFQSRLDPRLIPEGELEVLDALASAPGPLTAKKIAAELRAKAPNAVATYLKRLRERGLVRPTGTSRKDTYYDLTEPLFRVWRRFRLGRTEREQIVVLAEFIAAMFSREEIEEEWELLPDAGPARFRRLVLEAARSWEEQFPQSLLGKSSEAIPAAGVEAVGAEVVALISEVEREYRTGSISKAYEIFKKAIETLRANRNQDALARCLGEFAHVALMSGHAVEAQSFAEEGEKLAMIQDDNWVRAHAIYRRGEVLFHRGQGWEALQAFELAESIFQTDGGDNYGRARAIYLRGSVLFYLGQNQEALQAFELAESIFQEVGNNLGCANVIRRRGDLFLHLGQRQEALQAFRTAEDFYERVGSDLGRGGCHLGYGRSAFSQGDWEDGLNHLLEAYRLANKSDHRLSTEVASSEIWSQLARLTPSAEPERLRGLFRQVAPLVRALDKDEATAIGLVRLMLAVLEFLSPDDALKLLPILEASLPESRSTFLQPARLAAEVLAGKRPEELPEEPEEVRRTVREFLNYVEKAQSKQKQRRSPKKKPAKGKKVRG